MSISRVLIVVNGKVRAMDSFNTMPSGRKVSTAKNLQRVGEVLGRSVSMVKTPVDLLLLGVEAAFEKTGIDDLTVGARYGYLEAERTKAVKFGAWKVSRTQDIDALRATVTEKNLLREGEDPSLFTARQCAHRILTAGHPSPFLDEQSISDMEMVEDAERLAAIQAETEQPKDAEHAPVVSTGEPGTAPA